MRQTVNKHRKEAEGRKATDGRLIERAMKQSGTYGPSAYLDQVFSKVKPAKTKPPTTKEATPDTSAAAQPGSDDPITLLIAKNPEMNASTFFNLLKSEGFKIEKDMNVVVDKKEADAASAFPQVQRAGVKKEANKLEFKTRFLEADQSAKTATGGHTRYKVCLLEEGMGNFGASAYYSRKALESAIPVFEGKKIYADHPAESENTERPERSVRDILGHFENVHVEENKKGQGMLCGDVAIMGGNQFQWARELMEHAVAYAKKFPDKEFVGLSINASGDSEKISIDEAMKRGIPEGAMPKIQEAKNQGIDTLTYVSTFKKAVSCDLVTEAGAGGKILDLIEGANMAKKKVKESETDAAKKEADAVDGGEQKGGEGHDDAAQDVELIKKMIAKYMGGEVKEGEEAKACEMTEDEAKIAMEAYEAHKEMGCKEEEAAEKAAGFLKASKHMAAKREAAGADKADGAGEPDADDKSDKKPEDKKVEGEEKKVETKESAAKSEVEKLKEENIKLQGKLTKYEEADKETALKATIKNRVSEICKENKLDHETAGAKFKKLCESAKSVEEVNKSWAIFKEGYEAVSKEKALDFGGMIVEAEKTSYQESSGSSKEKINFGACVKQD